MRVFHVEVQNRKEAVEDSDLDEELKVIIKFDLYLGTNELIYMRRIKFNLLSKIAFLTLFFIFF